VIGEKLFLSGTKTKFPADDTQPLNVCSPTKSNDLVGDLSRNGSSCNPVNPFSVSDEVYRIESSVIIKYFMDSSKVNWKSRMVFQIL
jgi:hypothetical protein